MQVGYGLDKGVEWRGVVGVLMLTQPNAWPGAVIEGSVRLPATFAPRAKKRANSLKPPSSHAHTARLAVPITFAHWALRKLHGEFLNFRLNSGKSRTTLGGLRDMRMNPSCRHSQEGQGRSMLRFFVLAFLNFAMLGFLVACSKAESPYVESVEQLPSGFFRVFADIKVKETGEIVKLDYVVACGGTVTNWTFTTPSVSFSMTPHIMLVPTSSGQLIGARTPEVCDAGAWEPQEVRSRAYPAPPDSYFDPVPDDFLPLLMWYPNADDIGFAFGYLSDKAYESPYSKMEVLSSGIATSSLGEWEAWREDAKVNYKQVGALPGPWGHQVPGQIGSSPESRAELKQLNGGRDADVSQCYQVSVLELPDSIKPDVMALLPATDRKWVIFYELGDDGQKELFKLLRSATFNGGSYFSHQRQFVEDGVRRSSGGGAFTRNGDSDGSHDKNDFYHDKYPVAIFQRVSRPGIEGAAWEHDVLFEDEWNGFGICGRGSPPVDELTAYGRGEIETIRPVYEEHTGFDPQWLMDGDDVIATNVGNSANNHMMQGTVSPTVGRDGALITNCCWR